MTQAAYTVPDSPADVEAAALDLIAHMPGEVFDAPDAMTAVLQEFCGMLQLEGCFAGLCWSDAKAIAAAVAFDAITRDDGADFLRNRARNALSGVDNMPWRNRERAARALNIAATVLGL
jgi:hypothetical protein